MKGTWVDRKIKANNLQFYALFLSFVTLYAGDGVSPVNVEVIDSEEGDEESTLDLSSIIIITPPAATVTTAANRKIMDTTRKTSRQLPRRLSRF